MTDFYLGITGKIGPGKHDSGIRLTAADADIHLFPGMQAYTFKPDGAFNRFLLAIQADSLSFQGHAAVSAKREA